MRFHEKAEVHGHLMETGVLARILDDVLDYGGDYTVDRLDLGATHDDESHAVFTVGAETPLQLARILMRLQVHGANKIDPGPDEAVLRPADADGVFPEDFYATTNLETVVHINGQWVPVEHPEMDCGLVVAGGRVRSVPVSDVKRGDMVVCGADGIKTVIPVTDHSTRASRVYGTFDSMPPASSEQPQVLLVRTIARQIREVKTEGQQVLWVAGPAVVSTGAGSALAALVDAGFVDVLFAGNELATLDIEAAIHGTSPGVRPLDGRRAQRCDEQNIRAINTIRRVGSIRAAVEQGVLTTGILHSMVKANKTFVLVGSVGDDGPLPGVHTDVVAGQRAMRAALAGVGFTLMVSGGRYSIASSKILPASVPLACIDMDLATVHALTDRPHTHSVGVATDAGLFLEQLARELVVDYQPGA